MPSIRDSSNHDSANPPNKTPQTTGYATKKTPQPIGYATTPSSIRTFSHQPSPTSGYQSSSPTSGYQSSTSFDLNQHVSSSEPSQELNRQKLKLSHQNSPLDYRSPAMSRHKDASTEYFESSENYLINRFEEKKDLSKTGMFRITVTHC